MASASLRRPSQYGLPRPLQFPHCPQSQRQFRWGHSRRPLNPAPQAHRKRWGAAPAKSTLRLPACQRRAARSQVNRTQRPRGESHQERLPRRKSQACVPGKEKHLPHRISRNTPGFRKWGWWNRRPVSVASGRGSRASAGARSVWRGSFGIIVPRSTSVWNWPVGPAEQERSGESVAEP